MTLLLDGNPIPGKDHRVTAQGQIERKDLSGQTSATAASHGGWKAWLLQVSVKVPMEDDGDLLLLRILFQTQQGALEGFSITGTGKPKVFEITEPTANAMGIFKVRFSEFFRVSQREREKLYEVQFTLIEEGGIAEKAAKRAQAGAKKTPNAPSGVKKTDGGKPGAGEPEGWVEGLLKFADDLVGKYVYGTEPKK